MEKHFPSSLVGNFQEFSLLTHRTNQLSGLGLWLETSVRRSFLNLPWTMIICIFCTWSIFMPTLLEKAPHLFKDQKHQPYTSLCVLPVIWPSMLLRLETPLAETYWYPVVRSPERAWQFLSAAFLSIHSSSILHIGNSKGTYQIFHILQWNEGHTADVQHRKWHEMKKTFPLTIVMTAKATKLAPTPMLNQTRKYLK